MRRPPAYAAPVPRGPVAYRRQLRRFGSVAGTLPPLLLGAVALGALYQNNSTLRGALGFLCAVLAAPCLLVAGMPMTTGAATYAVAIAGSAVVWIAIGTIASRRATGVPAADWRDFWREYLWLAGGIWLGVVGALLVVDLVLGRPFL